MPTPHLRRARPIVQAHCAELGIPYHETGLLASWGEALRHLREVGAPIREDGARRPLPDDTAERPVHEDAAGR